MPTYAVLGATGQIGGHVFQTLLDRPDVQIRAFVRSRTKLSRQYPQITQDDISRRVTIHEGTIDNIDVLSACLRSTDAAFLCVAASASQPGCRIAQDQSINVVAALEKIRSSDTRKKLPTLIMLSSAETDDKLNDAPWLIAKILFTANYYIYTDLIKAEAYLRERADWIGTVFFKPGGISRDKASGHILSTKSCQTFVSFPDTAAGMVQIADDGDRWTGKSVSVQSRKRARVEYENFPLLFKGLIVYFLPLLYSWLF